MAKDLLFEIGAEEIPAGSMPNILGQLLKVLLIHLPKSVNVIKVHLRPSLMMLTVMLLKRLSALLVVKVLM